VHDRERLVEGAARGGGVLTDEIDAEEGAADDLHGEGGELALEVEGLAAAEGGGPAIKHRVGALGDRGEIIDDAFAGVKAGWARRRRQAHAAPSAVTRLVPVIRRIDA
jgi:hypothetical protein